MQIPLDKSIDVCGKIFKLGQFVLIPFQPGSEMAVNPLNGGKSTISERRNFSPVLGISEKDAKEV
jgi:hypothetical protein